MSRPTPKPTYQPDPSLWINTAPTSSSKSKSKKLTQRPLVSFNHGIATPLSSGYKQSTQRAINNDGPGPSSSISIRKRINDQSYTPVPKQGTLNQFMNTPSTIPSFALKRNKGKEREKEDEIRTPLSQRGTPIPSSTNYGLIFGNFNGNGKKKDVLKGSKLKIYQDDFWGSGDEIDEKDEEKRIVEEEEKEEEEELGRKDIMPPSSQKRKGTNRSQKEKERSNRNEDGVVIPSYRRRKARSPSPLPPAQSTRSHDPPHPAIPISPSSSRRQLLTRKSSSLPSLTPSLTPETEPTQPRQISLSPNLFDRLPLQDQNQCGDEDGDGDGENHTPPPNLKTFSSSPPPITPIPEYIIHNHKQICGRNPSQLAAIPSPWRKKVPKVPLHSAQFPTEDVDKGEGEKEEEKSKKRKRVNEVSKKDEIDRRVWSKAHEKRHKTPPLTGDKMEKKLVELSSSDPSSDPPNHENDLVELTSSDPPLIETPSKKAKLAREPSRKALTPLKNNALRGTISSSNIGMGKKPSPFKSPLTPRRRSKVQKSMVISPLPRTSIFGENQKEREIQRERSISPSPIKSTSKAFPRLSGKSPSPSRIFAELREARKLVDDLDSSSHVTKSPKAHDRDVPVPPPSQPTTPTKPSPKKHYQITPPKSSRPRFAERQETLFVLPDPPIQPIFASGGEVNNGPREWKVAEMEPETLLDWGLDPDSQNEEEYDNDDGEGGEEVQYEDGNHDVIEDKVDNHVRTESQSPEPPLFSPSGSPRLDQDNRPSLGERWSSKSIEPTALSQEFPRLFPSSPSISDRKSSLPPSSPPLRAPSLADGAEAGKSKDASTAHPVASGSKIISKWDHLQHGILSTPPITSSSQGKKVTTSSQKGKKRSRTTDENEQSKLASFGFFNDKPTKKLKMDFENKWEDEQDIDVPEDEHFPRDLESSGPSAENGTGRKLGKVPEAPYHPSLRPAGIRELERRKERESTTMITPKSKTKSSSNHKKNIQSSSPEPPLFENEENSLFTITDNTSGLSSSQSSSSNKTPGSTKDWWDKLGGRRMSEFGTIE